MIGTMRLLWLCSFSLFLLIFVFFILGSGSWLRLVFFSLGFLFLFLFYSLRLSPIIIAAFLNFLFYSIFWMFNIHPSKKFLLKTFWKWFYMHIVTISSSFASTFDMLFTLCIQKISDWRELSLYLFTVKESSIRIFLSILSVIFLTIFNIHISHNMIC